MSDIELYGATYPDVPAVDLPKSGGGTVRFYDPNEILFPVTSVNSKTGDVVLYSLPVVYTSGLQNAGWYRVLSFNADSQNQAIGYSGVEIDLRIGTADSYNERHDIKIFIVHGNFKFSDEISFSRTKNISKIRYTYSNKVGYIDIKFDGTSSAIPTTVEFTVHANPSKQYQFSSEGLTSVADSPSGETVKEEYTFSSKAYYKSVALEGISNGWEYVLYTDNTIDATRKITDTASNYTVVNNFPGYYISNILTPFTMANTDYYIGTEWTIGTGLSITAGVSSKTTSKFNAYALATASGSQSISLTIHLKGTIA